MHRSGVLHCYMLSLTAAAMRGLRSAGNVERRLAPLVVQFPVHFAGALVILETTAKTAALIAPVSSLFTITIAVQAGPSSAIAVGAP